MKKSKFIKRHFRRTSRGVNLVSAHYKRINYGSKWKLFEIRSHNVKDPGEYLLSEISAPDKKIAKKWHEDDTIFKEKLWKVSDIKEIKPSIEDELDEE